MSIVAAIKRSLAAQVASTLAGVMLVLTVVAAIVLTVHQTRQTERTTLEKARLVASIGAQQYGEIVDAAIDANKLSVADAFDRTYVPIKGYEFGDNPKYHTRYDSVTDKEVLLLQDELLADADFVYAIGVDDRGYIPTHNGKFTQPITGDPAKDLLGNRTKRLANYGEGIAAAKNLNPTLTQVYVRNTGEKMWDVSAPIYVKGQHWGAFRLGVSMKQIAAQQRSLVLALVGLFILFFVVTTGTLFFVVQRAMKPVVALTAAAEQISLGEALDVPLKSTASDEIGLLTKAIDRMRNSMKAAMSRLGH